MKKAQDTEEYKRVLSYFNCFTSEAGKNVLKDLIKQYHDVQSFAVGDAHLTSYREGQRSVVLDIISKLRQSRHPEIFERTLDDYMESE